MIALLLTLVFAAPVPQAGSRDRGAVLSEAAAAAAAGRRADAKRLFKEAGEQLGSVSALLQLARLQSGDGDGAGALESLQKARVLAPNSEEVLSAIAQLSLAARQPMAAAGALEPLTRMCPDAAQYHYLFGVALMSLGDNVRATDELDAADRLESGRPLTLAALGLAYNARKQFADAQRALLRSLELEPDRPETLAALAESEVSQGDLTSAEHHARRALDAAPTEGTALLAIGMVRLQQARYEEARDALVKAVAANPQDPKADYQLSLVYARLGDNENAERSVASYRRKLVEAADRLKALRTASPRGGER